MSLILFEDEHLVAVNKPAGWNTHSPSPLAGEGIYEWMKNRERRWARLAIIHRLDKETSGTLVFGKTELANRSLTEQFASRSAHKKYLLLTDRPIDFKKRAVTSAIVRNGERYISRPIHAGSEVAETHFSKITEEAPKLKGAGEVFWVEAEPLTGKTHQIRVHAAALGFPVLGDVLYGGTAAGRVFLHAAELRLRHPASGQEMVFSAPLEWEAEPRLELRAGLFEGDLNTVYRLVHGEPDGWPGLVVDRLGDYLLAQSEEALSEPQKDLLVRLAKRFGLGAAYHKLLYRRLQGRSTQEASPQWIFGEKSPAEFSVTENGLQYGVRFGEGYSVGLFLDQRENRRRLMTGYVAPGLVLPAGKCEVLNAFAYTCSFSVSAAKAGARTTSLDLSKKYLEWGKGNFALNGIDPAEHDFIFGDAFEWFRRLARRRRLFDVVLLDPPTFSRSKEGGVFQVERDCGKLVGAALPLLKSGGVLFVSTNAGDWQPERFQQVVSEAILQSKREIAREHYAPQPPDFPISRAQPAYLKTIWLKVI